MKITKIAFYERAALFAQLSRIAYLDNKKEVKKQAKTLGFTQVEYYNSDGAQAWRFTNRDDTVIACRGTEATCFNDIGADLNAYPVKTDRSRVHYGFKKEVDDIWPKVSEDIHTKKQENRTIWFTGHSLGGAMATIMAGRCRYDESLSNPIELHTFGSPRVGWRGYVSTIDCLHYRWVNNNDVVTRVPLWLMGYIHHGLEQYIDSRGIIHPPTLNDRIQGFWKGLRKGRFDFFSDHSIDEYIRHIERYKDKEYK